MKLPLSILNSFGKNRTIKMINWRVWMKLNINLFVIFEAIAALRDIHQLGYIHRDIKPQNMCFGLSQAVYFYILFQ